MAINHPLDFEKELVELDKQLEALRERVAIGEEAARAEYEKLEKKYSKTRDALYSNLKPYQRVQLSRHFDRPFTLDYVQYIFTDFIELHGDRLFRDDPAIVGGTAILGEMPVMIVGHQRGRSTQERLKRNFGMAQPEGYRKALRLFGLAEKFGLPVVTFIDTQGAFPGMEAEERGQAEAIARNLLALSELTVPVVAVVIGEGGSGGALALGIADRVLMLENACYSVITPEGCASILFGKSDQAALASELLKITATDLKSFGIIDEIVPEPAGGAHSNHKEAAELLRTALTRNLEALSGKVVKDLVEERYKKFRAMGPYTEA